MMRLVSNALVTKVLKYSPLTNKSITVAEISKLMDTDCPLIKIYPIKLAFLLEQIIGIILLSVTIIYVSGVAGLIGICIFGVSIFMRTFLKILKENSDKEMGIWTNKRVKASIELFNIIKFIKTTALESFYFNKLRSLR